MQPHPLFTERYRSAQEKQRFLRTAFDQCAPYYESTIRFGSFGTGQRYRRQALLRAGLKKGMRVLDLAAGTGPTARAAASVLGDARRLVCVDPSAGMLRESRKQLETAYVQGEADYLPLRDGVFDFLVMGYALRHVGNLNSGLRECLRVLKPGGTALFLEVTKPDNRCGLAVTRFYFGTVLPRLTRWFTGSGDAGQLMVYFWQTIEQMVPPAEVLEALAAAGFTDVRRHVLWGIFSEYSGTKPQS
jgi:demethylmenaquinone methyltransferase/2-methoxy-6-polyprenyl-1,4-benzoquinol methylase